MENIEGEIWKDIQEWPFHQVSNKGRIRVLPGGKVRRRLITVSELRKTTLDEKGYMTISQMKTYYTKHYIHALVLNAFVGPCPSGQECRHLNDNKTDNRWPENLEWGTREENYQDRIHNGKDQSGERHGMSKLTDSDIINIRSVPKYHGVNVDLAIQYKISPNNISRIRSSTTWKHIK